MMYEPKYKTPQELLTLAGFTQDHPGLGFIRRHFSKKERKRLRAQEAMKSSCIKLRSGVKQVHIGPMGDRFHALVKEGVIHLHYDREENGRHISERGPKAVAPCIKQLAALDVES